MLAIFKANLFIVISSPLPTFSRQKLLPSDLAEFLITELKFLTKKLHASAKSSTYKNSLRTSPVPQHVTFLRPCSLAKKTFELKKPLHDYLLCCSYHLVHKDL